MSSSTQHSDAVSVGSARLLLGSGQERDESARNAARLARRGRRPVRLATSCHETAGTTEARHQDQHASRPPVRSTAEHLEQVIRDECAAWIALLSAVPDYGSSSVALTHGQRQLVAHYAAARAERLRLLG